MIKNSILISNFIDNFNNTINEKSLTSQETIVNAFTVFNSLYNKSSAIEDVLTNELLSLSSKINSVNFILPTDKMIFTESFESLDFFDKKFHVDNPCSLDVNNRTLTLPERNVVYNKFASVVVEPGSNGTYGNSLNGFANNDLAMIFDNGDTSMFEYEKFTNAFTADPLTLNLTLKLDSISQTNGLYIKLFSEEGVQNPTIEGVSISADGQTFNSVDFTYTQNKNDSFIRYLSQKTRYVKILFKQQYHQQINTYYGVSFRYCIAIREIQSISTNYFLSGEYVSVPLSSKNNFSTVAFSAIDEVLNPDDITYYISANNGGKWVQIKNGDVLDLYSVDTGIPTANEVESVRIKIGMVKSTSGILASIEEVFGIASSEFYLKYAPLNLTALFGGHISHGNILPLKVKIDIPKTLQQQEYNQECILDMQTKSTVFFVPYYRNMEDDIIVFINGTEVSQLNEETGSFNYVFSKHIDSHNSTLTFNFTNSGLNSSQISISSDILGDKRNFYAELYFKPYVYTKEMSSITGKYIKLPYKSLYSETSNINIEVTKFSTIPEQTITAINSIDDSNLHAISFENPLLIADIYTDMSITATDCWVLKDVLEEYSTIHSYSITPAFVVPSTQYNTPKSWIMYGKGRAYVESVWVDVWVKIDEIKGYNWIDNSEVIFRVSTNCAYKELLFIFTENYYNPDDTQENKERIFLSNFHVNSSEVYNLLSNSDFTLSKEKDTIILKDSVYSSDSDYKISYYHGVDINDLLPANQNSNKLILPSINVGIKSSIVVNYDYKSNVKLTNVDYYSPICKEYKVSLI